MGGRKGGKEGRERRKGKREIEQGRDGWIYGERESERGL